MYIYLLREVKKQIIFIALLLFSWFPAHCCASCSCWAPDVQSEGYDERVDLKIYTGYVFGMSHEIVYNPSFKNPAFDPFSHYKESELFWKIRNLWILGGTVQWNYLADRLHFFLRGWSKLTSSRTTMVNKDWSSIEQKNPTDISWNRTVLKTAFKLIGEIDYDFYAVPFCLYDLKLGVLTGYQFLNLHWHSYGGPFWYDNGEDVGVHPLSKLRYTYQQQFSLPYLGLQLNWLRKKSWGIRTFGKYTWFSSAKDLDFHLIRSIIFIDKFGNGHWWAAGTEIHWYFWKCLGLDFTYTYERMNTTLGSSLNVGDSEYAYVPNGAGIFYRQQEFTLGLRGSF